MQRGTGWLPDRSAPSLLARAGSRIRGTRALVASVTRPDSYLFDFRTPWVLDQGMSEACTGHYVAEALYYLLGVKTSPWYAWLYGRIWDLDGPATPDANGKLPVQNVGVSNESLQNALANHGTCLYEKWAPGVDGFAWDKLPGFLARQGAQRFRLAFSPIYAVGTTALESVLDATLRRQPPGIVVNVDDAFDHPVNGVVGPESGPSRGRHIITGCGYRTVAGDTGPRVQVRFLNSWSEEYGDAGFGWLDEDRIRYAPYLTAATGVITT